LVNENSTDTSNEVQITKVECKNSRENLESPQKTKDCVIDLTDSPVKESRSLESVSKGSPVLDSKIIENAEDKILTEQSVNQRSENFSAEPEDVLIVETENVKTDYVDEINHWKHLYVLYDKLNDIQKAQYTCGQYLMDKKPICQKDIFRLQENIK